MKTLRKTPLSLAVAASLGMAVSAFDAGAVNLATDGIGEVAIAPYYTTRNGWMTLINLTNIENKPIVVKIRIHEGHNARDVLDFNIGLSANDMWAAVLQEKDGKAVLTTADDSCFIGSTSTEKELNLAAFTGANNDTGLQDADRLKEGYIEFIVMGYAEPDNPGLANDGSDIGYAIENHQCTQVRSAFTEANILKTAQQFGEPINALKFNFRFLNAERGIEAGGQAVTWANFFNHLNDPATAGDPNGIYPDADYTVVPQIGATPATNANCTVDRGAERRGAAAAKDWDPTTTNASVDANNESVFACRNLITAQEPHAFLEPSLNDAFPRVGVVYDDKTNQLWTADETLLMGEGLVVPNYNNTKAAGEARGVDAFSATIQRATIINEWVTHEGTEAEWVVTFPTKAFYVDHFAHVQAAIADGDDPLNARWETRYFNGGDYVAPGQANPPDPLYLAAPYRPFKEKFGNGVAKNGMACSSVSFTLFDREENSPGASDTIIDSPAETAEVDKLCYETNVLKFSEDSKVFESKLAKTVDVSKLTQKRGWLELDLTRDAEAETGLPLRDAANTTRAFQGLPAIGFMIKNRDRGNPEINYVSTIAHAYTRETGGWTRWNTP